MGGYGSGRTSKVGRRLRNKTFVGELPCLNSFRVMPGRIAAAGGHSRIRLGRFNGTATTKELNIFDGDNLIVSSPMQPSSVGYGTRYYFTCPGCRRRVAKLYLKQTFACRRCHNLAYLSQNISNEDRWLLKRERLLERFGLSFRQASYCEKKKWMHLRTFDKAVQEFDFLNDMGINIHLDRFDYRRVLSLLRIGRKTGEYPHDYSRTVIHNLATK